MILGKIIVIEGLDGCGKSTQLEILEKKLPELGFDCRTVSFPNYDSPACQPVKMYLGGEFGSNPDDVNAYAASCLYAIDRFASFKTDWEDFYNSDGIVVCGRYVTSNAVHQCSKLPRSQWEDFSDWLYDFEYNKIGIPAPDAVIFLSMPPEMSERLLMNRYEGDGNKKDIHEKDIEYQRKCREAAMFSAKHNGWDIIDCTDGENLRSIEDISEEILSLVLNTIKGEK